MSVAEAKELSKADAEHRKLNPNKPIVDPNRKAPVINRAPKTQQTVAVQSGESSEADGETDSAESKGGPNTSEDENSAKNVFTGVSGWLNSVSGTSISGCAEESGTSGVVVEFYVDGDNYSGSYAGYEAAFNGCNFTFQIPSGFWDGQSHTIGAYVMDSYGSWWELSNSPQTFQISSGGGGGGGGTGTNANWNNNNAPTCR